MSIPLVIEHSRRPTVVFDDLLLTGSMLVCIKMDEGIDYRSIKLH